MAVLVRNVVVVGPSGMVLLCIKEDNRVTKPKNMAVVYIGFRCVMNT